MAPGKECTLVAEYVGSFEPAIASQPGFRSIALLRPTSGATWLLLIDFVTEEQREAWVHTPLHQDVWSRLAASCRLVSASDFEVVS